MSLPRTLVAPLLAAVVSVAPPALAQQREKPDSSQGADQRAATNALLRGLAQQIERTEDRLRMLRARGDDLGPPALDLVRSRSALVGSARGITDHPAIFRLTFELQPDEARRVQDPRNTDGLILTGKWLQDYARLIRLEPEYENALASYKEQARLHEQLDTVLTAALAVKDKKVAVLQEMVGAQERRGDLYKTMAEIERDSWLDRFFHKIAFPAGVTIGLLVGSVVARN